MAEPSGEDKKVIELGKKSEVFGAEELRELALSRRPGSVPPLQGDEKVICGYDQGLGEHLFVCESLADMQQLYDAYARGGAISIRWYKGSNPGFIIYYPPTE